MISYLPSSSLSVFPLILSVSVYLFLSVITLPHYFCFSPFDFPRFLLFIHFHFFISIQLLIVLLTIISLLCFFNGHCWPFILLVKLTHIFNIYFCFYLMSNREYMYMKSLILSEPLFFLNNKCNFYI